MTNAEHNLLLRALPGTSKEGDSGLVESDLPPASDGRNLFATSKSRLSAARLDGGQVCYTYTTDEAAVAGCAHELNSAGLNPAGTWGDTGHTLFGFADDTVATIDIRTNTGELQRATLVNNGYEWNANDPTRSTYATAIIVSHTNDESSEVAVPAPDFALRSRFS